MPTAARKKPCLNEVDGGKSAVAAILSLALVQAVVQSIFFLNIFGEKGPRWNLVVYASTLTIIFIIIFFSIWIMNHLYYRMMP